jgi:hypothetical protein
VPVNSPFVHWYTQQVCFKSGSTLYRCAQFDALACEYAEFGITANAYAPGMIDTPLSEPISDDKYPLTFPVNLLANQLKE